MVTTIMLNYIALYIVAYVVTGPLRAVGATFARTPDVGNASLPILVGGNGHLGVVFAFIAIPVAWWLLYRSTIGFEKRNNQAFKIADEAEFVRFMTAEIPPAPPEAAKIRAANSGITAAAA